MSITTATRKAYKSTPVYQLDRLLAEETKWKRRATIAANKLAEVRERINRLARDLTADALKGGGQ